MEAEHAETIRSSGGALAVRRQCVLKQGDHGANDRMSRQGHGLSELAATARTGVVVHGGRPGPRRAEIPQPSQLLAG